MASDTSLQKTLARYAVPRRGRAASNLFTSVGAYLALVAGSCAALAVSPWLAGAISVAAAGFLLRTFIVFHDCAHGSFLPSKRTNAVLGAVLLQLDQHLLLLLGRQMRKRWQSLEGGLDQAMR